jgi:ankyrin repeat protein
MSDEARGSRSASRSLPDAANLEWLRKHAKQLLQERRRTEPEATLADAQRALANEYGFSSWRALKAHVDARTVSGQCFDAARTGDVAALAALLDKHPGQLVAREKPYEWSLLHHAAHRGHLRVVDLLLERGLDVNTRETGDNTYAIHWAAAAGHLAVVRRLADAGGDVVGHGDDHELEVIGWASCWEGCDDDAHRAVVDFLLSRGARHHIFSAIATNRGDEVRRIAGDPNALTTRMSRNENHQLPLQFAIRMNRPEMVELLLDLGADPETTDGLGMSAVVYAASPNVSRRIIELIAPRVHHVFPALALGDQAAAERVFRQNGAVAVDALHLSAKHGDETAVRWLLDRGADPNARWNHWEADVTPLHMAAWGGSVPVARALLRAGADPTIRDSKHDSDALGWAEHFGHRGVADILRARGSNPETTQ